jgi:hypothetical protein
MVSTQCGSIFRKRNFWAVILFLGGSAIGGEIRTIDITEPLPYKASPIDYFGTETTDAVNQLRSRIVRREVTIRARDSSGYLLDMLQALNVPLESQTLVFSRSSLQEHLIHPKNPRAIYFNDEVAVGYIPGAPVLEITAQDPQKGAIFYTVPQPDQSVPGGAIVFHREERCLECHASTATMNVPGYLLRSFQVDEFGEREAQSEYAEVTHAVPYKSRWGGWYVTGQTKNLIHGGNLFGNDDAERHEKEPLFRGTMADLSSLVDLKNYPSKHSDIVALMVLEHQLRFYDLVTRVHYEHRLGMRSDAEERLARYALLEDEAPMPGPAQGSTNFSWLYQSTGCRDRQGRSLRDLNLKTRLFENRLSPLVRSRAFQGLPNDVKSRLWDRFQVARSEVIHLIPARPRIANAPNRDLPQQNTPIPRISSSR